MKDKVSKENLAMMLGIYDELHYRKEVLGLGGRNNRNTENDGFFITNSSMLHERLALAQRKHARAPCSGKNKDLLLFGCLITKNDGSHLQEWLVWQIVVVGANHVVVYLNDPAADNTWAVLQPFVAAGYVTAINATAGGYQVE